MQLMCFGRHCVPKCAPKRQEDIDKNRAEAARIRAEERLQHQQSMHEYYQSKIALDRAMQRLQAAAKYRR